VVEVIDAVKGSCLEEDKDLEFLPGQDSPRHNSYTSREKKKNKKK
jgi:hypothetical protein